MPKLPSPTALTETMSKADQVRHMLGEGAEPKLIADMIEGETNVVEYIDAFIETIIGLEHLADVAKDRAKRMEAVAESHRAIVQRMMDRIGQNNMVRPLATLSMIPSPGKVHLTPEAEAGDLPVEFLKLSPDRRAIGKALKAGQVIIGATLSNQQPSLHIITGKKKEETDDQA